MKYNNIYVEHHSQVALGQKVYHDSIYKGNEPLIVTGIRENELELEGDYSGGTHNVAQKDWLSIKGTFRKRKVCDNKNENGDCPHHNIHCTWPNCEPYL